MRQSPSIIPTDGLDRDIYLVLEDPRSGAAWRETDETATDFPTLIDHLLTGQYEHPLRAPDNILGQRFLVSNHIRRRRRVCSTKCGRRARD